MAIAETSAPGYAKGLPIILLNGADSSTYLSIYSVGPANGNPALFDASHQGGQTTGVLKGHVADIAFVRVTGTGANSILAGNAQIECLSIEVPVTNRVVFHGQADYGYYFGYGVPTTTYKGLIKISTGSTLSQDGGYLLIAGGNIVSPTSDEDVLYIHSQNGTDSAGNTQTAQTISGQFFDGRTGSQIYPTITY